MTFACNDNVLFSRKDLSDVLRGLECDMTSAIDRCDSSELLDRAPEEMAQRFMADFSLDPVELLRSDITQDHAETKVDVRRLRNHSDYFYSGSGAPEIPATGIGFYVPFSGNPKLFELRPSTFTSNPPRGVVSGRELVCTYVSPTPDPEKLQTEFDHNIRQIESYLQVQRRELENFRDRQAATALAHITERRARLLRAHKTAVGLRYPQRARLNVPTTSAMHTVERQDVATSTRVNTTSRPRGCDNNPHSVDRPGKEFSAAPLKPSASTIHYFVSYTYADEAWAEWIAWVLEAAGYRTTVQKWDFQPGNNFISEMHRAASRAERTIAVLSPRYLASKFAEAEWAAALRDDPTGIARKLIPVRIAECTVPGLLGSIVYIDLFGKAEAEARQILMQGVQAPRAKPLSPPAFPGDRSPQAHSAAAHAAPLFPGSAPVTDSRRSLDARPRRRKPRRKNDV